MLMEMKAMMVEMVMAAATIYENGDSLEALDEWLSDVILSPQITKGFSLLYL
jgi:hypothetical protein